MTWWEVMPYATHPGLGIGGTSPGEGDILAITHSWGWVNKWGAEFLDHPLYPEPQVGRWGDLLGSWVTSREVASDSQPGERGTIPGPGAEDPVPLREAPAELPARPAENNAWALLGFGGRGSGSPREGGRPEPPAHSGVPQPSLPKAPSSAGPSPGRSAGLGALGPRAAGPSHGATTPLSGPGGGVRGGGAGGAAPRTGPGPPPGPSSADPLAGTLTRRPSPLPGPPLPPAPRARSQRPARSPRRRPPRPSGPARRSRGSRGAGRGPQRELLGLVVPPRPPGPSPRPPPPAPQPLSPPACPARGRPPCAGLSPVPVPSPPLSPSRPCPSLSIPFSASPFPSFRLCTPLSPAPTSVSNSVFVQKAPCCLSQDWQRTQA